MRSVPTKAASVRLWAAQIVIALVFLFAGIMKFVMPIDVLAQQAQLPGLFMRFIGLAEILGALGLVLPGIFRIRTELTALAASGLVIIMTGAVTITVGRGQIAGAIVPFIVCLLAAFVARNRWQWNTVRGPAPARALQQVA